MFSRAFSSQVQPVEIARKLAKEMDGNRTASVSRVYVPNQYTVFLSTEDHERLEGYERLAGAGVSGYLLEHARRRDYAPDPPRGLARDRRALAPRRVRDPDAAREAPARQGEQPEQGEQGQTMVYSAPKEPTKPKRSRQPGARLVETRAIVSFDDRRYVLEGPVAVLGRSRESDCVFRDPNISRRHAELRRGPTGDWQVVDLGSTNGVKVNGRRVESSRLSPGDEVTLGTTRFVFDIEQ